MQRSANIMQSVEFALEERAGIGLACLISLDHLEMVEVAAGIETARTLRRRVHGLLRAACQPADLLLRRGDREFLLILPERAEDGAAERAQARLSDVRACRVKSRGQEYSVAATAAMVPLKLVHPATPDRLIRLLGAALLAAREAPGGVMVCSGADAADVGNVEIGARLLCDLPQAARDNRLALFAQEIRSLAPGAPEGVHYEVLSYLVDRQGQMHPPARFIRAAERTGLIGVLDRWVIRSALVGHAAPLQAAPQVSLSLNLSGRSLADPALWPFLRDVIAEAGIDAARLTFEITETWAIDDVPVAQANLAAARAAGCRIALDDFGAGLSGFGYLKSFSPDSLKIDGALIPDAADPDSVDAAIVESVVLLGRRLGISIVAEHVDHPDVLRAVHALGVDKVQGFHIAQPVPFGQMLALASTYDRKFM